MVGEVFSAHPISSFSHTFPPGSPYFFSPSFFLSLSLSLSPPPPHRRVSKTAKMSGLGDNEVPKSELLSKAEQQLCMQVRLVPVQYLAAKAVMVAAAADGNAEELGPASLQGLFNLDARRASSLYEFMSARGWLTAGAG